MHDAVIRALPHPLRARWRNSVRPVVIRAEPPMKAAKVQVRAVRRPSALHAITEAVAVAACEQAPGAIELGNLPAAMDPVRQDIANKPGSFPAEAARGPADRNALMDGLPIVDTRPDPIVQCDGVPRAHELDRSRGAIPMAPLHAAGAWPRQKPGTCQLHDIERSAVLNRAAALPVVATARHRILSA